MILVLGGTREGREIAGVLAGHGCRVLATVVSGYGAELITPDPAVEVLVRPLDAGELDRLLAERDIRLIIDATHPYARVITETAWEAAQSKGIPYVRYERPPVTAGDEGSSPVKDAGRNSRLYRAGDYKEAAQLAVSFGETVFLTIGSRNLEPFIRAGRLSGKRIVARVLPDAGVLVQCAALGILPQDIIALQGPFSLEMNMAMFREYKADVLVTKDSGSTGGTDTKLAAAAALEIPVVMVARPDYPGIPVTDRIDEILRQADKISRIK